MKTVSFCRAGEALVSSMVQVVISLVVGFFFFSFVVGCFVLFSFCLFIFLPCSEVVEWASGCLLY